MKIVIAPNAFKGSMTAGQAAKAMVKGIESVIPDADTLMVPVADGGDGLVDVFTNALSGNIITRDVQGPLWRAIHASYCLVPDMKLAAVEMALASGLALLKDNERNPMLTTTYGTGELIADALARGAQKVVIGIGGSSTNDCGIGMAAALGVQFLDKDGKEVKPVGGEMINVTDIDLSGLYPAVRSADFEVACDVDNPLIGEKGAARVYGPQKGATEFQVRELEDGLENIAAVIEKTLGIDVRNIPGSGAAGGLGAGLMAFLNAKLRKGIDLVFDTVELEEKIRGADLVLTAEGQIDFQTKFGKAPAGVGAVAKKLGVPCIAIAGSVGEGINELHDLGISAVFSLCAGPICLSDAMTNGSDYLTNITAQVIRAFIAGRTI